MRRRGFLLALVVGAMLTANMVPDARAAGLSLSGSSQTTISYTPESGWKGDQYLQLSIGVSSIYLRWFEETQPFWNTFSPVTLYPSSITLRTTGPFWANGPNLKGALGDFNIPGPVYIAGQSGVNRIKGILVEDIPFPGTSNSSKVYWGWEGSPASPVMSGATALGYGFSTKINDFHGLGLSLYGAMRNGMLPIYPGDGPKVIAPDGSEMIFSVINGQSDPYDGLHLFTEEYSRTSWFASLDWDMAFFDKDFRLVNYIDAGTYKTGWGPPGTSPNYDYVIAAYKYRPEPFNWMRTHLRGRLNETIQLHNLETVPTPYHALVGAAEFTYNLAGIDLSGQVGRYIVDDPRNSDLSKADFKVIKGKTTLAVLGKEVATKPLSLTLEYRNIESGFMPWARSTETRSDYSGYNRIEALRGQKGWNFNASTTVFPENPVDVSLTYDTYVKDSQTTTSYTLVLATKYAGYNLTNTLSSSESSVEISRPLQLGIPAITKFTPAYKLTLAGTPKHTFSLDSNWAVGGFKGIEVDVTYEAQGSSTTTSLAASYNAPNGWGFSAGWKQPDDQSTTNDTYLKVYYKIGSL